MKALTNIIAILIILSAGSAMAQEEKVRYEKSKDGLITTMSVQSTASIDQIKTQIAGSTMKVKRLQTIRGLDKATVQEVVMILQSQRPLIESNMFSWTEIVDKVIAQEQANIEAMQQVTK